VFFSASGLKSMFILRCQDTTRLNLLRAAEENVQLT